MNDIVFCPIADCTCPCYSDSLCSLSEPSSCYYYKSFYDDVTE